MEIQKGIEIFTKDAISKAPFDVTEIGVINSSTQNGYSVKIKGKTYNNVKTNGGTCTIGEVVKVLIPQNQYNNMFILKSGSENCTGNSATATKLQTPRTIMGVPFDGTANILEDTGWVEFGPSLYMSNLTAWSAYQKPKYRKIGSVVYISGALKTTAIIPATSGYDALILPQEIWVNNSTNARSVNQCSEMNRASLMVNQVGSTTQYLQFGNYGITTSIDIPSGSYINISMMYMTED